MVVALPLAHGIPEQLAASTCDAAVLFVFLVEVDAVTVEVMCPIILTALIKAVERVEATECRQVFGPVATQMPFPHSVRAESPGVEDLSECAFVERQAIGSVGDPLVDASVDRLSPRHESCAGRGATGLHIVVIKMNAVIMHRIECRCVNLSSVGESEVVKP
jgi:hypothetical protein